MPPRTIPCYRGMSAVRVETRKVHPPVGVARDPDGRLIGGRVVSVLVFDEDGFGVVVFPFVGLDLARVLADEGAGVEVGAGGFYAGLFW